MASLAGHDCYIDVSLNDIDYYTLDGIKNVSDGFSYDTIDVTEFTTDETGTDYQESHILMSTLAGGEISLAGDYVDEATGQGTLRVAFHTRALLYIRIWYNGVAYIKYSGYITGYNLDGSADGVWEYNATFTTSSARTTGP